MTTARGVFLGIVAAMILGWVIYSAATANDDFDCSVKQVNGERC